MREATQSAHDADGDPQRTMPSPRRGGPWRRHAVALLVAALTAAAGATRVAVDFQPTRARLLTAPTRAGADGTLSVTIPSASRRLSVLVAQIDVEAQPGVSTDTAGAALTVSENGRLLGRLALKPPGRTRIDLGVSEGFTPGAQLQLRCEAATWSVAYLEVANLHGFSGGLFNGVFVPATRRDYQPVASWLVALLAAALVAAWLPPRAIVEAVALAIGVLMLALALVSPIVSRYAIVLAPSSFVLAILLVYGGSIARRYRVIRVPALDAAVAIALVGAFYVAAALHGVSLYAGNYHRFLHVSDRFVTAPVLDSHADVRSQLAPAPTGYDGQFMFLMAFDPLLRDLEPVHRYRDVVDSPPYRYGRIGFSVLTRVVSGGAPRRFAATMVWLIVGGQVLAALFMVLIARARGASPFAVLPYILIPGFLVSVGNGLPESIAAALLLGGLWAHTRQRPLAAIALWGASLLVRETGVLLVVIVVVWDWVHERGRVSRLMPLLALLPALAWRAYVGWRLAPDFGWHAFWTSPGDLTVPFTGFVHLWSVNDAAHGHGQMFTTWFPLLLVALLVLSVVLLKVRPGPLALAGVGYALVAVSLNYEKIWSWTGNGERGTFEAFLVLLVAALPASTLPRPVRRALAAFAIALFVYDFQYATHATWFRAGLIAFH